jgi:hypothetical protein
VEPFIVQRVPAMAMHEVLRCRCIIGGEFAFTGYSKNGLHTHHCPACGSTVHLEAIYPRVVFESRPRNALREIPLEKNYDK